VGHAEESHLVAGLGLEVGEIEHVGLGATSSVEELVDMKDPQL
jgi:hypothetical protein